MAIPRPPMIPSHVRPLERAVIPTAAFCDPVAAGDEPPRELDAPALALPPAWVAAAEDDVDVVVGFGIDTIPFEIVVNDVQLDEAGIVPAAGVVGWPCWNVDVP